MVKKETLCDVLMMMGIPAHMRGFEAIMAAVPYVVEGMPMGEVYRRVAEDIGSTPVRVERNIRTAAEGSSDRLGAAGLGEVYGNSLTLTGKPTNYQLLKTAGNLWQGVGRNIPLGDSEKW